MFTHGKRYCFPYDRVKSCYYTLNCILLNKFPTTNTSPLRLELFHYIQKIVVDLRLIAKLQFHLV